jgi:hypothetical protein
MVVPPELEAFIDKRDSADAVGSIPQATWPFSFAHAPAASLPLISSTPTAERLQTG